MALCRPPNKGHPLLLLPGPVGAGKGLSIQGGTPGLFVGGCYSPKLQTPIPCPGVPLAHGG